MYPIAVLVDANWASASEIVAGALRYNERAVIVGERTFGKGSVQNLHPFYDDSKLKLTISKYLTAGRPQPPGGRHPGGHRARAHAGPAAREDDPVRMFCAGAGPPRGRPRPLARAGHAPDRRPGVPDPLPPARAREALRRRPRRERGPAGPARPRHPQGGARLAAVGRADRRGAGGRAPAAPRERRDHPARSRARGIDWHGRRRRARRAAAAPAAAGRDLDLGTDGKLPPAAEQTVGAGGEERHRPAPVPRRGGGHRQRAARGPGVLLRLRRSRGDPSRTSRHGPHPGRLAGGADPDGRRSPRQRRGRDRRVHAPSSPVEGARRCRPSPGTGRSTTRARATATASSTWARRSTSWSR